MLIAVSPARARCDLAVQRTFSGQITLVGCVALCFCSAIAARAAPTPAASQCRLLLTNDDGIEAVGLHVLARKLASICEVVVVAPATNQSGASQSIPHAVSGIRVRKVSYPDAISAYSVDGTPAESAAVGLLALNSGRPFDLVVSGLNPGENTGLANLYSGTVSAAMEAAVRGTSAIAVSQDSRFGQEYSLSAEVAREWVERLLRHPLPAGTVLNINVPTHPRGTELTYSGNLSTLVDGFRQKSAPDASTVYVPNLKASSAANKGDVAAYQRGLITVVPLSIDRTDRAMLMRLRGREK